MLERIEAGEMPPKNQPRPTADELGRVIAWLNEQLLTAERRERAAVGQVGLRRLNRLQYENTVHDLLAIDTELQSYLPEDKRALGFDNVGTALSLSSAQLEAYLEAADAALDAAIVNRPRPVGIKKRLTGMEAIGNTEARAHGAILELEDAAVGFGKLQFYPNRDAAPEEGWYRVRISAFGYQSQGKPVEIYARSTHTTGDRLVGYFDVPPDVPQVIEFTCRLKKGGRVAITTPKFPYVLRKRSASEYTGAGLGVQWIEMEGPLYDSWPPTSHRRLFGDLPLKPTRNAQVLTVDSQDPKADAKRLLTAFLGRAYRRPVALRDVEPILALVSEQLENGTTFEEAMRVGYKAILCSPDFLFFQEKHTEPDDTALASRLSYFLWSTMPDEDLLALAASGKMTDDSVLRAQVERMLNDPRAQNFVRNFVAQWLDLRLIDFTMPDTKLYPEFDIRLRQSMVEETELFFAELLKKDLSLTNFVHSDFSFLNERLATHYGIPGVEGMALRRVALPAESHRGGVLTHASVLKVTANGTTTSPVIRGVWVLKNILGKPPDPPPPNAGAIEPDIRGATTIREELDKHRRSAACASCHVKIDPLGFALESFDVAGGWRENYRVLSGPDGKLNRNGPKVEAGYHLADGREFRNIDDLKQILLEDKDQLARALAEKLLIYSTGRGLRFSDRAEVKQMVARVREKNYGLRSLVHEVVQSEIFRGR